MFRDKGRLTEAIAEYREAIRIRKDYAEVYYDLGNTLRTTGQLDDAIVQYRKAIKLKDDYAETHCNLVHTLAQQGHFHQTLAEHRLGHDLGGGNWFSVAVVLQPNGDLLEAGSALVHTNNAAHGVFAVARFLPSEPQVGAFTANQVMAGAPVTLTASNITDGNPNSTIGQVTFFYYDSNGNKIAVGTVTAPDGSGNWTVSAILPPGSYTLYAQATDSYGILGDPLGYTLTVQ